MQAPSSKSAARAWRTLVWAVPLSGIVHVAGVGLFLLALVVRPQSCARGDGPHADDGEHGAGGAGGRTVEIAIEGPAAPAAPAAPIPAPPAPRAEPAVQPSPRPAVRTHTPRPTPQRAARTEPAEEHHPWDPPTLVAAQEHPEAAPAPEHRPSSAGTNSSFTSGGQRAGSVGHQRSLLPRAAMCNDPVAGTWRGLTFNPLRRDWFRATLQIQRDGAALSGMIVARIWYGTPDTVRPPPCGETGLDLTVDQPGRGSVDGQRVVFGARSFRIRAVHCNPWMERIDYAPDNFSGTIDPARQEFQSVNNDGRFTFDEPIVFRRIACQPGDDADREAHDDGAPPSPAVP